MVTSRLINSGDAVILEINGTKRMPFGYMSYNPQAEYMRKMREAGVRLFFLPVYAGNRGINPQSGIRPFHKGFCAAPGEYNFSAAEKLYRAAAEGSVPGDIYIIPRVMLEPPVFWEKSHPGCLARDYSGVSVHESYSSEEWLSYACELLEAFGSWLRQSGYDEYTAGVHLACGWTEEFMRPIIHSLQYTDYSEPSKRAWREYIREKYKTVQALSAAWGEDITDFDAVCPPTPAQRRYTANNTRPPKTSDYNHFHSLETARAVCRLAGAAKRIFGDRIVGAFYGYCGCEFGHTAVDTVLDCPDVDFLASPFSYYDNRPQNLDWAIPGPLDSCMLRGKTWFVECDVRTHLSRPLIHSMPHAAPAGNTRYEAPVWYGPDTEKASLNQMKKAFAKCLAHGTALWWFDMWGGWYDTDAYREFIKTAGQLYAEQLENAPFASAAQTALVYDMGADEYLTGIPDRNRCVTDAARCGVPFLQYELCDLEKLNPQRFRAIILINAHRLTAAQRTALAGWASQGRSVILINSLYDGEGEDFYTQELSCGGVKVYPGWQLYSFEKMPEPALLREALLTAGVHIYSFDGDIVYAGGGIVSLTAVTAGEKRLYLPFRGALEDVFSGETPEPCEHFTDFKMEEGETRVYRVKPGA